MNDSDYLNIYDATPLLDGCVDFDYNENRGELSGLFEDTYLYHFTENLNNWN